jgi:homoaconitate hydratase
LNFGTGSSREQAATALKYFGIPCVIAASFSETYKRNAFNNGFVVFECRELIQHLRSRVRRADPDPRTMVAGDIEVDYTRSLVRFQDQEFSFPPLSPVAQELVVAGGAENVIASKLHQGHPG